jgi:hypothetical protein
VGYEILSASADRSPAGRPTLTVYPDGAIRVNTNATTLLREMGAERVLLLWDRDKRKLAIMPAAKNDVRSYKLRFDSARGVSGFAAKAMMKKIGWNAERTVRIPVNQINKMLEGTVPMDYLKGKLPHAQNKKPDT